MVTQTLMELIYVGRRVQFRCVIFDLMRVLSRSGDDAAQNPALRIPDVSMPHLRHHYVAFRVGDYC